MGFSIGHMVLLLVIVLVVFGAGKIPQIMGDVAKGVKAFKKGINDGESEGATIIDVTEKKDDDRVA